MDITLERILSLIPRKSDGKYVHGAKKEFAQSLGLENGNLIVDWEKGRTSSYHNYLYQIAAKYDVSVEWLKGETDEKNPPVDTEGKKAALLASLEDMSKDELVQLIFKATEVLKEK
ncbi:MAG: hypothetical protein IJ364_05615 [Oscillospiraceae bacterium]|nr:hypothetical protein [Oscillospiraceae bacterium]